MTANSGVCGRSIEQLGGVIDGFLLEHDGAPGRNGRSRVRRGSGRISRNAANMSSIQSGDTLLESQRLGIFGHDVKYSSLESGKGGRRGVCQ